MPTTSSREMRESEGAVRAAVIRLSRPDREGGAVIERAAIEAWIIDHGGQAEAPTSGAPAPGVYRLRPEGPTSARRRTPRRYVLPAAELGLSR